MQDVDLRELRGRIPLAGDRALAEIVNGLNTAENMTATRAEHGFFSRVILGWNRQDRKRAIESDSALALAQRRMIAWAQETAQHLAFTDLTVGLLAMEVDNIQHDVVHLRNLNHQALDEIRELAGVLTEFIDAVDRRLAHIGERIDTHERMLDAHSRALLDLDRRVLATELWQSAWSDGDMILRRWRHRGAYVGLPWLCQVLLVARECAGGRTGQHEFVTGDRSWRERLADDILSDSRSELVRAQFGPQGAQGRKSVRVLIERIIEELPDPDEREMVAEVLGIGLSPRLRPPHRPIGYALARGLELSALGAACSEDPARVAVEDARRDYGNLQQVTYEEYVRGVIHEQADAALQARGALRKEREEQNREADGQDGVEKSA
ncbi:hypothetical protein [Streptomyces antarcticus]|uniref:hypothetical protein n=1 Tax=Streptomyces antarcticus TaxID=2996458 RepID=UPI00227131C0|nr:MULTISPECIES: hypothetical protein [unclassified Streptomyces]MCY0947076.1 hypothetical protein [Streptomyces sp. H34-AA3]MCZ4084011.1 hypothetical protein [Streptomyces sp. H34-S5]